MCPNTHHTGIDSLVITLGKLPGDVLVYDLSVSSCQPGVYLNSAKSSHHLHTLPRICAMSIYLCSSALLFILTVTHCLCVEHAGTYIQSSILKNEYHFSSSPGISNSSGSGLPQCSQDLLFLLLGPLSSLPHPRGEKQSLLIYLCNQFISHQSLLEMLLSLIMCKDSVKALKLQVGLCKGPRLHSFERQGSFSS